jgi:hypothetical protein
VYSWPQYTFVSSGSAATSRATQYLLGSAFEQASAAAGEGVATEKRPCSIIGNVRARMTGDVGHGKIHAEFRNGDAITFGDGLGERRDRLVLRPVDRHVEAAAQLGNAADVVGMVVGCEDCGERELLTLQIVEHRPRLARIDYRGVAGVAQRPDVVVLERGDRNDRQRNCLKHEPVFLRA